MKMSDRPSKNNLFIFYKFVWVTLTQGLVFILLLNGSAVLAESKLRTSEIDRSSQTSILIERGIELYQAGKFTEGVTVLESAIANLRSRGNILELARSLNYLALTYQKLGELSQAERTNQESLNLLQSQANATNSSEYVAVLARTFNTQGHLQLSAGQAQKALESWQEASKIYLQIGDEMGAIGSKINQAQALKELGFYRRALNTATEVRQSLEKQPDSVQKAIALRSLGNILRLVGAVGESEDILGQSLSIAERQNSAKDQNAALLSLGNTARARQEKEQALEYYQRSELTATSATEKIQAQLNQLSLLLEQKQWLETEKILAKIRSQIENLPIGRTGIYTRLNLAQSLLCLKQYRLNRSTNLAREKSSPILQQCYSSILSSDKKSPSLTSDSLSPIASSEIQQLLSTAIEQARSLKDSRAEAEALGYLAGLYQQTQQWSAAEELTQQALLIAEGIDAGDISYRFSWQLGRLYLIQGNRESAISAYAKAVKALKSLRSDLVAINPEVQFSFRDSVEPVYREFVGLLLRENDGKVSQENLQQARDAIESLQLAELENFFRQACLDATPVSIDRVDPEAIVVYPIILADRLETIVSFPSQPLQNYSKKLSQDELEKIIEGMRLNVANQNSRKFLVFAEEIYNWLIQPIEEKLKNSQVKTLVFVLDGPMRNIPMAALYDGERYLVEKYSIALTPGLQLVDVRPLTKERLQALTAGLSEARANFPALPNVKQELEKINLEVPSRMLLDRQFTSTSFESEISAFPAPIVHLATHGQFSSKAEETFIMTWDRPIDVNELNIFLRSRNARSRNPIELLVLSACETVTGDNRAALGLAGISVKAGARSTLGTLWSINDATTALLMGQFYEDLAQANVTKAEALRLAQVSLLRDPQYSHPYFWASYVLVGNWL
jgi:CHAT domain-containing protein